MNENGLQSQLENRDPRFRYVTHVSVSGTEREFFMSFFLIANGKKECVAQIILSEPHLVELITILQMQLSAYRKRKSEIVQK